MKKSDAERCKLLAGWFDRASTSCLTVGVLAPTAGALYIPPEHAPHVFVIVGGALFWLSAAIALHSIARNTLEGLDR